MSPWCSTGSSQHLTSTKTWRSSVTGIVAQPQTMGPWLVVSGCCYINLRHQCRNTACKVSCFWLSMLDLLCSNGHQVSSKVFLVPFLIPPTPNLYLPCTVCSSKLTNFSASGVTCITAMLLRFLSDARDQGTAAGNQSVWGTEMLHHEQGACLSWNINL